MRRKILTLLISTLLIMACAMLFVACSPSGEENPPETPIEESLSLNVTSKNMIVGETFVLRATYNELPDGVLKYTITYGDDNIKTVSIDEDGTVLAEKVGTATITASYGTKTATCELTVTLGDKVPTIALNAIDGVTVQLTKYSKLDVMPTVSFNQKSYEPDEVNYTLSDETFGTIENGTFTASKIGTVTLDVQATWQGVTLNVSQITITIISDVQLYLNNDVKTYELYSVSEYKGNYYTNEIDFVITATEYGESKTAQYEIVSGDDVVSIENNKIKGLKKGVAQVKISYVDSDSTLWEKTYTFNVSLPMVEVSEILDFSLIDGSFTSSQLSVMFESNTEEIADISCLEEEITAELVSGKINITGEFSYGAPLSFLIEGQESICSIKLRLYTKVIDEASDLACLTYGEASTKIEGYYILANNIDASGYTHNQFDQGNTYTSGNAGGFVGTFDGRGYTIDGITMNGMGLLGDVKAGATVKNLAITNIKFGSATVTTGLAGYIQRASGKTVTFSNIYLHAEKLSETSTYSALFAANHHGGYNSSSQEIISNCIFVLEEDNLTAQRGSFAVNNTGRASTHKVYTDVYIVSPTIMAHIGSSNDASNKAAESKAKYDENGITYTAFNSYTDVIRYNDFEEMTKAGNSYATFSSDYWDTTSSVPVWKNLPESLLAPEISFNDGLNEIILYTSDGGEDLPTSLTINASANSFGNVLPVEISLENNADVVALSQNTLTANGVGSATLVITVTGTEYKKEIPITVLPSTIPTSYVLDYSMADGFTNEQLTTVFGGVVTLDEVSCASQDITVSVSNNILNLSGSIEYDTPIEFNLYANGYAYSVKLRLYTKVLYEANDLACLTYSSASTKVEGYYILANNIDASGYTHNQFNQGNTYTSGNAGGFAGTFDGRGYTIDGITMNGMGLLGDVKAGATVKNLAITNIKFGSATVTTGLAGYIQREASKTVTFSNIYLHAEKLSETSTYSALFAANHNGGGANTLSFEVISNCIFVLEEDNLTAQRGSFAANNTGRSTGYTQYTDVYIVSPTIMAHIGSSNDASNKAAESKAKYDENGITYTAFNSYTNVTRYNDFEEMTKAGNSYATFSSDYWDTAGDYPVWKNLI